MSSFSSSPSSYVVGEGSTTSLKKIVEIKNFSVDFVTQYGTVKALEDVNLEIREGETLGLIGETGCGKSVTSRSILGLLPPNAVIRTGKIQFGEIGNVWELKAKDLQRLRGNDVAMIFQDAARSLNPTMKVGAQISEAIMLHRIGELTDAAINRVESQHPRDVRRGLTIRLLKRKSRNPSSRLLRLLGRLPLLNLFKKLLNQVAKERCVRLLTLVQIALPEKRVDEYPHEMSGGMRQRAMIAMALACNPKLLIADEPTTALDVTTQYHVLQLIKQLKKEFKTTVLLVTHNFGIVAEMCDRVAVMYAGSIVEVGKTSEIFERPLHPYTRGLLSAIHEIGDISEPKEIAGFVPNLIHPPTGCRFHPRCSYAEEQCTSQVPKLVEVEPDHMVACFPIQRQYHRLQEK